MVSKVESLSNEVYNDIRTGMRCVECSVKLGGVEPTDDTRFCVMCAAQLEHDDIIVDASRIAQSINMSGEQNG